VGKTTLARQLASGRRATLFDLEVPADLARLSAPMLTLEPLRGLVVIDEVQRLPRLFEVLRGPRGSSCPPCEISDFGQR
jgi:predicted AAA+ superfamily ATPase